MLSVLAADLQPQAVNGGEMVAGAPQLLPHELAALTWVSCAVTFV